MNKEMESVRIFAIVPAAGMGRRAGGPKQTFAFGDSTLAGTVVQTLLETEVTAVIVVTRTPLMAALRLPRDPRVEIAINDVEDSEMIDSIRIGLRHIRQNWSDSLPQSPRPGGVMVLPSDMPGVSAQTMKQCITAFQKATDRIVMATHRNKFAHPILFPLSMQAAVEQLEGGLNLLPKRFPDRILPVEIADPDILSDIDTAEEYKNWKRKEN